MAFKLQKSVLNERMITFQRTRILQELEKEPEFGRKLGKLPRDQPTTEFIELSCLQRILSIYQLLQHNRHLDSSSSDREQLLLPHLPVRLRFAVLPIQLIYRICQGEILSNQIELVKRLIGVLHALQAKTTLSEAHLGQRSMEDFYWSYPLRGYLKQLHSNRRLWESGGFFSQ